MKLQTIQPDVVAFCGASFRYVVRVSESDSGKVYTFLQRQRITGSGSWDDAPGLNASELATGVVEMVQRSLRLSPAPAGKVVSQPPHSGSLGGSCVNPLCPLPGCQAAQLRALLAR